MPTSGEILRGVNNVQQFVELATEHQQGLVRDGYVYTEPIPAFLRPYTKVRKGYPENRVVRWDYIQGVAKGAVVDENDRAPFGKRDIFGVEALEPLHIAGHSMTVTPKELRRWGAQDMLGEIITQPYEEWLKSCNELIMDVATSGGYAAASPSDNAAATCRDFSGVQHTLRLATNSANTCSATVANSSQLVQFAARDGTLFAAGHDHVTASVGGVWTRARGKVQAALLYEHPGQNFVDAYVGSTVKDSIEAVIQQVRGLDGSGIGQTPLAADYFENGMATKGANDFGVPEFIKEIDNVRYFFVKDLNADLGIFFARGTQPLEAFIGMKGEDGQLDTPFGWDEKLHRELRGSRDQAGIEYGFRGHFGAYIRTPVGMTVAKFV